ncbi:hypothetical protein [Aeoliella sp. SH292]|uniref:hypothetical protein n=1 Tax=Aeoliella sp. SH292 TaxID=3454464 RepID=UPI003F9CBD08
MVDTELRLRLAQDMRLLVTGRLSNDDFDDSYYDYYRDSKDPAVRVIGEFCWALYSSDVLWPYYLKGWHEIGRETKRTATYAFLFLHTNREYGYPLEDDTSGRILRTFVQSILVILGTTLLVCAWLAFSCRDPDLGWLMTGTGIGVLGLSAAFWKLGRLAANTHWQRANAMGQLDVWPFLSRDAVAEANGHLYLLEQFIPPTISQT